MEIKRDNVKATDSLLADLIVCCHSETDIIALVNVIFAISNPENKSQSGGYYEKFEQNVLTALIALLNLHGEELELAYSIDTLISLMDDAGAKNLRNSKIEDYYKNLIKHKECDLFTQCYGKFENGVSETSVLPVFLSCIMRLQSAREWFAIKAKEHNKLRES